ncbi:hypothetical protein [Actinokineospora sp. NPDC004072]
MAVLDESDPAVRAARARFAAISADFGDRLDAAKKVCREKLAEAQRPLPPPPPPPPPPPVRRRRPQPDDPSDTGFFEVSWMTKGH